MYNKGSFVDLVIKTSASPINFIRSTDENGRACFFFIMCSHLNLEKLERDSVGQYIDFEDYGKIITSGFGGRPSQKVIDEIREKYDINPEEEFDL